MSRLSILGTFVFIRKERVRFVGAVVSIMVLYRRLSSSSRMIASIEYGSSSSREGIDSLNNIVRKSSPLILAKLDLSCTSLLARSVLPELGYPVSTRFQSGNARLQHVPVLCRQLENLLRETVSSAGPLALLRVCRDEASDSVVGQKYQLSEFLLSKLIMASEA